jgi:hypothetical protein
MKRSLKFQNPANGHVEDCSGAMVWCFLMGPFYLGFKGMWGWAVGGVLVAILTAGLFWLVLPFFVEILLAKHYLQKGWSELPVEGAVDRPAGDGDNLLIWAVWGMVAVSGLVWGAMVLMSRI